MLARCKACSILTAEHITTLIAAATAAAVVVVLASSSALEHVYSRTYTELLCYASAHLLHAGVGCRRANRDAVGAARAVTTSRNSKNEEPVRRPAGTGPDRCDFHSHVSRVTVTCTLPYMSCVKERRPSVDLHAWRRLHVHVCGVS